jgi:hypothetical protein
MKSNSCGIDGGKLVFIVGCPRSGTTYLQRLLAYHPKIKTGQESHLFYYIGPLYQTWQAQVEAVKTDPRGGVGLPCYFDENEFIEVLKNFLDQLLAPMITKLADDELFIEKSPSHALYLNAIHELLPKARIIHLVRDARDVVSSLINAGRTWGKHWAPKSAINAALLWRRHINAVKLNASNLPNSIFYEVRYEDLLEDQKKVLKKLGEFLEIDWADETLEQAVNVNSVEMARKNPSGGTRIDKGGLAAKYSGNVVNEPQDFVRKGTAGSWRKDLTFLEKFFVWMIARSTMRSSGYSFRFPWR